MTTYSKSSFDCSLIAFEEFVGLTLRAALSPQPVHLQRTDRHALEGQHRRLFALRPDIVVNDDLVIDTKWKELKPGEPTLGVKQADVYQMLAYARAYKAERLVLLYPWHEGMDRPGVLRRWRVTGTNTAFDIATVGVGKPDSVRLTLREIVGMGERTTPLAAGLDSLQVLASNPGQVTT